MTYLYELLEGIVYGLSAGAVILTTSYYMLVRKYKNEEEK